MTFVRNAIWNLSGQVLPLLAAIVVIPFLLRSMGAEGFGLVTIIWTLIGYFSLFDFGLGRALTKFVSMEIGQKNTQTLADLIITAMLLLLLLGIVMGILVWLSVPWLVANVLKPTVGDPAEVALAFHFVALAIPFVVINVGLRALLEGLLRFDLTNLIRVPFGLFTILSPALISYFGYGLPAIVLTMGAGILAALLGYALLAMNSTREFNIRSGSVRWTISKRLLGFGGWISISNFVAPVIFHLDRFVISAVLSVAVMAYYIAPYEAITKVLILSSAIAGTLFPVFAKTHPGGANTHMATMLTGTKVVMALTVPVLSVIACFGFELLQLWVGREVAINGIGPLRFLVVGVFFNAIAYMPYTLLQANGRADIVAKIQLIQIPIYPLVLWASVSRWHLDGAAVVWVGRAFFEMALFFFFARKLSSSEMTSAGIGIYVTVGASLLALGMSLANSGLAIKALVLASVLAVFSVFLWFHVCNADDRSWVAARLRLILDRVFRTNYE